MIWFLLSDQLYDWSERLGRALIGNAAEATSCACAPPTLVEGAPARFSDRALQALWQARMQMCRRAGTWSEVLPFCEHPWSTPRDGIRSARLSGRCHRVVGQLPTGTPDHPRDLRHQSGASASQGSARLTKNAGDHPYRYRACGNAHGQHAPELPRSGAARRARPGGGSR